MQKLECKSCGSTELYQENGYLVCRYCGTRHLIEGQAPADPAPSAQISLNADVEALLQKCRSDPARAAKYATLILEIDPNNAEARRYLGYGSQRSAQQSGGCYIATAVYGSYDCPEVWTLRRFRDERLARHGAGRAFIRIYYALSPALVRRFGSTGWFRAFWRARLDRLVRRLQADGLADTPYRDRPW